MKIVADKDIYRVEEYFSSFAQLELIPGRDIDSSHVKDADVLLVRTVTKVDKDLVEGASLKFIGSASSGADHVDKEFLSQGNITFCNAAGCNANAVVDYVFSALATIGNADHENWLDKTVGIIGAGNVGGRLAQRFLKLGVNVKIYDPFLGSSHELAACFTTLEEVLKQNIVSVHTPLTLSGSYPTFHLLDSGMLSGLQDKTILINAGRGEVIDNNALEALLVEREDLSVVLDVWEGEPAISLSLCGKVRIATPHIAGYSEDGKRNGTEIVFDAFCKHFGFDGSNAKRDVEKTELVLPGTGSLNTVLNNAILQAYTIENDCMDLACSANHNDVAATFDYLRNSYTFRREFSDYQLSRSAQENEFSKMLKALGFCPA